MSDLAARLGELGPTGQRALLARILALRQSRGEAAPLSHAQRQLWFLEKLANGNPFYNESTVLRFLAPVDHAALERTFDEIVARHEVLRTNFEETDGEPVQRILTSLRVELPLIDLSERPAADRDAEAARRIDEQAREPFDLSRAPLLRVCLIRMAPGDHLFALTMHHIVCDGWSMRVLFHEMQLLYAAFLAGRPSPLPPLPAQYRDYGAWQRERLGDGLMAAQLDYWADRLAGLQPLDLPTDRPRPAVPSFTGGRAPISIGAETGRRLRFVGERASVTPFMALLAAFQALLQRYSGQDDIAVGCPVASRSRPEWEPLLGFFVNTLVMRTDLSGNPSFRELLRRVREVALSAYAHQDLPFERLVERLQPERHPGRNPLFQVTFQIMAGAGAPAASPGLLEAVEVPATTSKFDLRCDLWPDGEGYAGYLEYSADLFEPTTAESMARHYEAVVAAMAATPNAPISEVRLPLLPGQDRLVAVCAGTRAEFPPSGCVHRRVEAVVAAAPGRLAVSDAGGELTYAELDASASRLAARLVARGIRPGCLVVLVLPRSAELVVAALAVLKAGAAYVPLDPAYPPQRLALLMRAALAPLALTTTAHRDAVPAYVPVLLLDGPDATGAANGHFDAAARIDEQALAYVVFTSGSTGAPRGVEIRHASLNNLVDWHLREYAVTPADRATLCASPAFDASVWEMWPYLVAGASLHVPDEATNRDTEALASWMAAEAITLSFLPTPVAELFVGAPLPDGLALRALLTGGDRLRHRPARPLPFRFVNHYGPTECTVVATYCDVEPAAPGAAVPPPIGRPIANVEARVLDRYRRPVPPGVRGELYLGGASLARGYLGDAEATRHRFVASPFDGGRTRLYRSGDRVRQRGDGLLEFLGRLDDQIKLRGFRIEPAEVEAAIVRHPRVAGSAVLLQRGDDGEAALVACIVPRDAREAADSGAEHASVHDPRAARVAEWAETYERVYAQDAAGRDDEFDIVGWNSSYTGEPLPAEAMREQFDGAAERVRALGGRRLLEIGCGTGLMMLRLAGDCDRYVGTDFAATALDRVARVVERRGWRHVELWQRDADRFDEIEPGSFDVVLLHSVVQYFPDVEYLLRVIEGAARATRDGGFVYVGDVRNLRTAPLLHAAVELARGGGDATAGELLARADRRAAREVELLVDPDLFHALPGRVSGIASAALHVRRGRSHNELTRHRFDAVLEVGAPRPAAPAPAELAWTGLGELDALRAAVRTRGGRPLRVRRVPSAALEGERRLYERLQGSPPEAPARSLAARDTAGIEPEDLHALAAELHMEARIEWSRRDDAATYDALFAPPGSAVARADDAPPRNPWSAWTNTPHSPAAEQALWDELRAQLRRELPEHMVPSAFVAVGEIPLTPNGKLDRRALDGRLQPRRQAARHAPPRGDAEHRIAAIWREVLGLDRVGVHENFFDLGGHSLLLVKVHHRLRAAFGPRLGLVDLFRLPTVAAVAAALAGDAAAAVSLADTATAPTVSPAGDGGGS